MPAGLVGHDSIYLVTFPFKPGEETLQERLDHLGCMAEHSRAAHMEHIHLRRSCRVIRMMKGAAAQYHSHISATAIGFKSRVPDRACLPWRTTSDNSRGGSVTKQGDTFPLVRVERVRNDFAATDQDGLVDTRHHQVRDRLEREEEAEAGGVDIKTG